MADMFKQPLEYLRYTWNRGLRHLYSHYRWVVFFKPISEYAPVTKAPVNIVLRRAGLADYADIVRAYPAEFAAHLPEALKRKQLYQRGKRDVPCFLAETENGELIGATWCPPYRGEVIEFAPVGISKVFEMVNTFVVSRWRGQGVGQMLRQHAIDAMARDGYEAVISFVWYSRQSSLKMNLRTGSRVFAEKRQRVLLGRRRVTFHPRVRLDQIPLAVRPPLLLVGRDRRSLDLLTERFREYGLVTATVWAPKGGRSEAEQIAIERGFDRLSEGSGNPVIFFVDRMEPAALTPLLARLKSVHVIGLPQRPDKQGEHYDVRRERQTTHLPVGNSDTAGAELETRWVLAVLDQEGHWLGGVSGCRSVSNGTRKLTISHDGDLLTRARESLTHERHAGLVLCLVSTGDNEVGELCSVVPESWAEFILRAESANVAVCGLIYLGCLGLGRNITCWRPATL